MREDLYLYVIKRRDGGGRNVLNSPVCMKAMAKRAGMTVVPTGCSDIPKPVGVGSEYVLITSEQVE
jgi:hypothetical protein